jgi:MFS family permease
MTAEEEPKKKEWRALAYFRLMIRVFGWKFVAMVFVSQFVLKGFLMKLSMSIALPLFQRELLVPAERMQVMMTVVFLAWAVKPLIGVLSDIITINGWRKSPWMWLGVVLGVFGSAFMFLAHHNQSAWGICFCMFLMQTQIAMTDLMVESVWSATMQANPKDTGSSIVSLGKAFVELGSISGMLLAGPLSDLRQFEAVFALMIVCAVSPAFLIWKNWIGETPGPARPFVRITLPTDRRQRFMITVVAMTGVAAIPAVLLSNFADTAVGLAISGQIVLYALIATYYIFPRMMFRVALFQVLIAVFSPSIGGALDFFYTAGPECLPNGPHFSYSFFTSIVGIIGISMSLLGIFVYELTLTEVRYRTVLIGTQVLSALTGASDLFLVLGLNLRLGIPYHLAYVLGEAIAEPLLNKLNDIPTSTLLSKVAPKGLESSSFSFLAGIANFAYMISEMSGALIYEAAGVKTTVPCNFSSLWWVVLLCHFGLRLFGGVPASWLIPNKRQNEALDD